MDQGTRWGHVQLINNRSFNSGFPTDDYTIEGYCALLTMLFMDLLVRNVLVRDSLMLSNDPPLQHAAVVDYIITEHPV